MTENSLRWQGIVALVAGGLSLIVVIANLVHTGKVYWAGVVIGLLALVVWRNSTRRS